jgi:hypothetical protein
MFNTMPISDLVYYSMKRYKEPRHRNAKSIWNEGEDGWWAILKDGLEIDDCVGIHEETKAKLLSRLNDARPAKPEISFNRDTEQFEQDRKPITNEQARERWDSIDSDWTVGAFNKMAKLARGFDSRTNIVRKQF